MRLSMDLKVAVAIRWVANQHGGYHRVIVSDAYAGPVIDLSFFPSDNLTQENENLQDSSYSPPTRSLASWNKACHMARKCM